MEECVAKSHSDDGWNRTTVDRFFIPSLTGFDTWQKLIARWQPRRWVSPRYTTVEVTIRELPAPADRNSRTSSSMLQMSFLNVFQIHLIGRLNTNIFTTIHWLNGRFCNRIIWRENWWPGRHPNTILQLSFEQWLADAYDLRILFKMTWLASC